MVAIFNYSMPQFFSSFPPVKQQQLAARFASEKMQPTKIVLLPKFALFLHSAHIFFTFCL
jgi:hypothetical protein